MFWFSSATLCAAAIAGLLASGWINPAAAQQRVGSAGAVNEEATSVPPGAVARRLVVGQEVVFNERVTTGPAGQTQLLFLDESALTVGPNSDVTIDQFVYDPNRGSGQMAMSAGRGVLRFVGGKLSKQENAVTLRTTSATIAIRGGVFLMRLSPAGQLEVVFVYGDGLSVTGTTGITQSVHRPGYGIGVAGPGAAPSAPFPVPPGLVAQILASLDGRPGGRGGAPTVPTDATIAASGVDRVISANILTSRAYASRGRTPPLPPPINPNDVQLGFEVNTIQATGNPVIANSEIHPPPPGTPIGSNPAGNALSYNATLHVADRAGNLDFWPVTGATLQNGLMNLTVITGTGPNAGPAYAVFPLGPGFGSYGTVGTISNPGGVSGNSFMTADNSAFYATIQAPSVPGLTGLLVGGLPLVNLPTAGNASYAGPATGLVFNNGANYLANGTFQTTWNFAQNSGSFFLNNFDGRSLSGQVSGSGGAYSGQINGGTQLLGAVGGNFFGNQAAATGGTFSFNARTGPSYIANGVYAGSR